jgi:hypothetical protein
MNPSPPVIHTSLSGKLERFCYERLARVTGGSHIEEERSCPEDVVSWLAMNSKMHTWAKTNVPKGQGDRGTTKNDFLKNCYSPAGID